MQISIVSSKVMLTKCESMSKVPLITNFKGKVKVFDSRFVGE